MAQWAAILTGGDGTRLRNVTAMLEGDDRPKQFCRLLGNRTMLDDTRDRIAGNVSPDRTLLVFTARHRPYYAPIAEELPGSQIIEQPANRGTAPAIAYAVGRVARRDPDGVLAVVPSDHAYLETSVVRDAIDVAMGTARLHPRHLVLIGAAAERPEPDYGWIVPGPARAASDRFPIFGVEQFCEKPGAQAAADLWADGCLWNTFITIGTVRAFIESFRRTAPDLARLTDAVIDAADDRDEAALAEASYAALPSMCFSRSVLAAAPEPSLVVRMTGAGWIDVGHPDRLAMARHRLGDSAVSRAS
jgi:mannose-1-phosphate guanylyltransferase